MSKKKPPPVPTKGNAIHPEAMKAMREKLGAALESCVLEKGYPQTKTENGPWGWDFAECAAKERKTYLSTGDAWSILYDITKTCFETIDYKDRPTGSLKDALDKDKLKSLGDSIIAFIESVPRRYSFYLRLAHESDTTFGNTNIARDLDLLLVSENDALLQLKPSWDDDTTIGRILRKREGSEGVFFKNNKLLRVQTSGFVDNSVDESAAIPAISKLKCTLYLGALVGVFKHEQRHSPWGGKFKSELLVVDEISNDGFVAKVEFPHEVSSYIAGYGIVPKPAEGLLDGRSLGLAFLKKILDSDSEDENRLPIATAAEWAFDSAASTNQTVSFIQLCIALEAILGDEKTKEGLTKTLADRCAYLLGKTTKERMFLREQFEKLYDHRSKIVHGRRVHLGKDAEDSLYWGKNLLKSVLRRELQNFSPVE